MHIRNMDEEKLSYYQVEGKASNEIDLEGMELIYLTLFLSLIFTHFSNKNFTTSKCPFLLANRKAENPR